MKVNVIAPLREDWILTKFAKILDRYIPEVVLSEKPIDADIHYYMNYALFKSRFGKNDIVGGWYTHIENSRFLKTARQMDFCICHAQKYAEYLDKNKIKNVYVVTPGIDEIFKPKLILGICGRKYGSGRKGEHMIDMIKKLDFVELKFTHPSWDKSIKYIPFEELPVFYNNLDYLLNCAIIEGGPIPVGEAIKSGKKVISPLDIGNVKLFKENIISYKKGDFNSLKKTLDSLYKEKLKISNSVKYLTWENFALKHKNIFEQLSKKII